MAAAEAGLGHENTYREDCVLPVLTLPLSLLVAILKEFGFAHE
jgi:hypothetical protein